VGPQRAQHPGPGRIRPRRMTADVSARAAARPNVVLIGFMGTGKTAVGRMIAARLGCPFIDTDTLIEERAGRSIPRIFTDEGEEAFRRLEAGVVAEVGERDGVVIATGGGVVLRPENMANLRRAGVIVALNAEPAAILARVGEGAGRPLLGEDPEARVRRLLAERTPLYRDADLVVDTSALSLEEVAERGLAFVEARAGPGDVPEQVVGVDLGARAYEIRIGSGLLGRLDAALRDAGIAGHLALLTHPRLDALYGRPLAQALRAAGREVVTILVRPSEASKSLRVAAQVYDRLLEARFDRHAALLALGGGVAGDLGGFVAATFLRGIPWIAIPTTLLAQVDASIGGKTAVNHPRGKNLIGAVHQPSLVVADIETLRSLPRRELRSGMAEVVKTGIIGTPDLFEYLERDLGRVMARRPQALAHVVGRCAAYKAGVVATDERETGERMVLNYGHTIGHAIEAAGGYRGATHGEAIAVGMTLEARLAVRLGICDAALLERQTRLLEGVGLPVRLAQLGRGRPRDPRAVLDAMTHDKKVRAGQLRFVLPLGLGRTAVRDDVPPALLEEVLADG